jgi:hypothetical protein
MTARETLIQEIDRLPESLVYELLALVRQRTANQSAYLSGQYADYWRQYIGAFAGEEWERPTQGVFESRDR